MTTLKALAAHLGLSEATVSRALNGFDSVKESTRQRVEQAAKDLNYRPNLKARQLATGKSNAVGLIMPDPASGISDSMLGGLLRGIVSTLSGQGIDLVLFGSQDRDPLDQLDAVADSGKVDGMLVLDSQPAKDPRLTRLAEHAQPIVKLSDAAPGSHDMGMASADYEAQGRALAQAMLRQLDTRRSD